MPMPNGGLITETNSQYYAGAQGFVVDAPGGQTDFTFTFNTVLKLGSAASFDPLVAEYALNNFKLYSSPDGITYTEYTLPYVLTPQPNGDSLIQISAVGGIPNGNVLVCQLKTIDGGSFGNRDAYGETTEENYGSYSYVTLQDIVNNFIVGYVGQDKLIARANRSDIIFHAKRGLQEFSYDTLKSIKS